MVYILNKVQHFRLFYFVIMLSINKTNICEINHFHFTSAVAVVFFLLTNSKRLWPCDAQDTQNLWQAIFGHSILVWLPCCAVGQVSLHMLSPPLG